FGASIPTPRAILAISAHWYINATAVTAMETPKTIHDFYGFPPELFAFEYPAPGDPALAEHIIDMAEPIWVGRDVDSWGIDHGTWSVLAHLAPQASIPVVQLSIDATKSLDDHIALGARLAPLREEGILIVASGNVVHNLGRIDWSQPEGGFDWALSFDAAVRSIMADDPSALPRVTCDPSFGLAVPTPDHFLPLAYLCGVAAADGETADVLVGGPAFGSLTMTSFVLP
ncbi:MAG: 4,5-DOPA dioxygenase extradiol, partial [Actinomycetota bacterium]